MLRGREEGTGEHLGCDVCARQHDAGERVFQHPEDAKHHGKARREYACRFSALHLNVSASRLNDVIRSANYAVVVLTEG